MIQRKLRGAIFAPSTLATLVLAGALVAPVANAASVIDGDYSAFGRFDWSRAEVIASSGTATLEPIYSLSFGGVGIDPTGAANDLVLRGVAEGDTARDVGVDFPGGSRAEFELGASDLIASAGTNAATAAAQVGIEQSYGVTGNGTVDIRIPYEYSLAAVPGGAAQVIFLLRSESAPDQALSFLVNDDTVADSGTIELQLAVTNEVPFTFNADIFSDVAVAAVPVPAAWLLFASALLVLRRRAPKDTSA